MSQTTFAACGQSVCKLWPDRIRSKLLSIVQKVLHDLFPADLSNYTTCQFFLPPPLPKKPKNVYFQSELLSLLGVWFYLPLNIVFFFLPLFLIGILPNSHCIPSKHHTQFSPWQLIQVKCHLLQEANIFVTFACPCHLDHVSLQLIPKTLSRSQ